MNPIRGVVSQVARTSVFALDRIQQRRHGVYEFEDDPLCIMRISRVTNRVRRELSDGSVIRPGAQVIEIHFWNERMPRMPEAGPDMAWGIQFTGRFRTSLKYLARHLASRSEYDDVVAVFGESSFAGNVGWDRYVSVFRCLGFDFRVQPRVRPGAAGWLVGLFVHLYVWTIVWVLNPASLKGRRIRTAERGELWVSRAGLTRRYGDRSCPDRQSPATEERPVRAPAGAVYAPPEPPDRGPAPRDPSPDPSLRPAA